MKKSLVIISYAFIFLLSMSFVSANFFDWITGDIQRTGTSADLPTSITETVKLGKTAELSSDTSLTVTEVNEEAKTVTATVTNVQTGVTKEVTLQEGTNTLADGTTLNVLSTRDSGFLRKASATFTVSSPEDIEGTTGTEGAAFSSPITQAILFEAGEYIIGDDVWVLEGEGDTLTLTINGLYKADLKEGVYNIPALCTGNHVVTISDGVMNVDTVSNTIPATASQF